MRNEKAGRPSGPAEFQKYRFFYDYDKKLIGKYFVVELNSIFGLLSKLKDLNKEYAQLSSAKICLKR